MNVSKSSATATASTSDVNSTQTQSKTSSSSKSDKSFEDEMKTASKTEETKNSSKDDKKISNDKKTEKDVTKEANKLSQEMKEPDDIVPSDVYSGGVNFTDFKYHNEGQSLLSQNIQDLLNTKDLMNTVNSATTVDYDVINMSDSDANFFENLVQNTDMSMQSIAANISDQMAEGAQNIQKNVQVSSVLMDKLAESMKTNQPFIFLIPVSISCIMRAGSSSLGLSLVIMVKSAILPETSPISKRLSLERFPPHPNKHTILLGLYSLSVLKRLSRLIALCA